MTHSEARQALRESSFYNCIVARLHAHEYSRGVTWATTDTWSLARYDEIAAQPRYLARLQRLGAIERRTDDQAVSRHILEQFGVRPQDHDKAWNRLAYVHHSYDAQAVAPVFKVVRPDMEDGIWKSVMWDDLPAGVRQWYRLLEVTVPTTGKLYGFGWLTQAEQFCWSLCWLRQPCRVMVGVGLVDPTCRHPKRAPVYAGQQHRIERFWKGSGFFGSDVDKLPAPAGTLLLDAYVPLADVTGSDPSTITLDVSR